MNIPLRNKKKEIIGYTKVSTIDFDILNKYKWYKAGNYIQGKVNGKMMRLHRYIMIEILGHKLSSLQKIDHINNDPLDNTRENLRNTTDSENSRNTKKRIGLSSIYKGVSKTNLSLKFAVNISINGKIKQYFYTNEIHAAHQYNLWIDKHNLTIDKNIIDIPVDFVEWKAKEKRDDLPTGIRKSKNGKRFTVSMKKKQIGTYDTIEEAIEVRNYQEEKRDKEILEKRLALPIQLNEKGLCFFLIKNQQIIVDTELFHELMKYTWNINSADYINTKMNNKVIILSRFLMNCPEGLVVDHINNNPFDNRKCNLRILTTQQNNLNKSSATGSSSKYVGVYRRSDDKKWCCEIKINGKTNFLGNFKNEIDAAKARDIVAKNHSKFYKLNFP